jgi:integrase
VEALAPNAGKTHPATRSGPAASISARALKTAADMRASPLFDLMEEIAPTHQSPIRPSRRVRSVKDTSRRTLDHDILQLINARIEWGIGSPEDPPGAVFSLPSLVALTDYLQKKNLDPRTIGRMLERVRWLRRRLFPLDEDHGSLFLSVIGREHFLSKPPRRRDVSHIGYADLMEKIQAFLVEIEDGIKRGAARHSLRRVEWRDLLIVALMLTTGIRIKNAHGLRSGWIRLGPNPCLNIPAGSVKNAKTFVCALPHWLVTSLCAYAPRLGKPGEPDFSVWRSRDTASLSRASVERSIRKTSLCLLNEPLQPHDYRRLRCIFVQNSAEIDQRTAHYITGHEHPESLYNRYPSYSVPDYTDDVIGAFRRARLTGSWPLLGSAGAS